MNDKLSGDIGRGIKVLAIVSFYVLTIASIVLGIILIAANDGLEDGWWALFIIFFGPIVAFILYVILFGFGELVEDTHVLRSKIEQSPQASSKKYAAAANNKNDFKGSKVKTKQANKEPFENSEFVDYICPACKEEVSYEKGETDVSCPWCGTELDIK